MLQFSASSDGSVHANMFNKVAIAYNLLLLQYIAQKFFVKCLIYGPFTFLKASFHSAKLSVDWNGQGNCSLC
jgi:hypothetical protein